MTDFKKMKFRKSFFNEPSSKKEIPTADTSKELREENEVLKNMQKILMKRLKQQDCYFNECMMLKQKEIENLNRKLSNFEVEKASLIGKIRRMETQITRYKQDIETLSQFIKTNSFIDVNHSEDKSKPTEKKNSKNESKKFFEDKRANFNTYVDVNLVVNTSDSINKKAKRRQRRSALKGKRFIKENFYNSFDHFVIKEEESEEERGSIDDRFNNSALLAGSKSFNSENILGEIEEEIETDETSTDEGASKEVNMKRKNREEVIEEIENEKKRDEKVIEDKAIFGIDDNVKLILEKIGKCGGFDNFS